LKKLRRSCPGTCVYQKYRRFPCLDCLGFMEHLPTVRRLFFTCLPCGRWVFTGLGQSNVGVSLLPCFFRSDKREDTQTESLSSSSECVVNAPIVVPITLPAD